MSEQIEEKARIEFIDALKGLGIILVVFGHFIEPYRNTNFLYNALFVCIYAFHMPLFCFCSGIVAKFNLKKIVFQTGWVYISAQIFYLLFRMIVLGERVNTIFAAIHTIIVPWWHMWYLYALLFWTITIPFVDKVRQKCNDFVLIVAATLIGLISGYFEIPLRLQRVFCFYIFFFAGYLLREKMGQNVIKVYPKKSVYKLGILLLVIAGIITKNLNRINTEAMFNYQTFSGGGYTLLERMYFYIIAFLIILLLVNLFMQVNISVLNYLGKYTLPVFIFHAAFVWLCQKCKISDYLNKEYILLFVIGMTILCVTFLTLPIIVKTTERFWKMIYQCMNNYIVEDSKK